MPEGRDPHQDAADAAWAVLLKKDLVGLAADSGGSYKPGSKQIVLKVLDKDCIIDFETRKISHMRSDQGPVRGDLRILILHYLQGSGNAQLANKLVTFREFEGGVQYYSAFKARTIDFLVRTFGKKTDVLKHIGDAIRAEPMHMGDVSFKTYFFPKVPVVVVIWLGDEEVPTSANVLFDANAGKILPTEDISHVGGTLCSWLAKLERA
jgi:Domain of unknown function (DUF3786)